MTTDRPYSAAKPVAEALAELHRCSGDQFDPVVVDAIDRVLTARVHPQPELTQQRNPRPTALRAPARAV
jgi:HD-GYP domain-containing protein (c-di-GMP phosphodiesterase class II)